MLNKKWDLLCEPQTGLFFRNVPCVELNLEDFDTCSFTLGHNAAQYVPGVINYYAYVSANGGVDRKQTLKITISSKTGYLCMCRLYIFEYIAFKNLIFEQIKDKGLT